MTFWFKQCHVAIVSIIFAFTLLSTCLKTVKGHQFQTTAPIWIFYDCKIELSVDNRCNDNLGCCCFLSMESSHPLNLVSQQQKMIF